MLGHDLTFWLATGCAAVIKVLTSQRRSVWQVLLSVFVALFSAWLFTDAALDWFNLNPVIYKAPLAGVITLTGEGLMRFVIAAAKDPALVARAWRGVSNGDHK